MCPEGFLAKCCQVERTGLRVEETLSHDEKEAGPGCPRSMPGVVLGRSRSALLLEHLVEQGSEVGGAKSHQLPDATATSVGLESLLGSLLTAHSGAGCRSSVAHSASAPTVQRRITFCPAPSTTR